ncbi:flavodoxin family protein [uncultured Megasphaera sp.]|uniref:flavodoxin family protein n=1 Tax=uncultured Megasphaera sp. TaxID=165188 RepID=UPI00265B68A1|nr:flavodoxin family protein [uncultured Megasphaera sp.]
MNRREFLQWSGAGLMTLFLSGCGTILTESASAAPAAGRIGGGKNMNIVVLTGSPHRNGTSALLADKFIEGAQSAGHTVFRFNAAFEDTHPCQGCDHCGMDGDCIFNDAIQQNLMPHMLEADMIALITPLYYYGMSAQLKTVVDRFYSRTGRLHGKQSILMATAYNSADWTMTALVDHYDTLVRYMEWNDRGKVLAIGCGARSLIERSPFPDQAYRLGASL